MSHSFHSRHVFLLSLAGIAASAALLSSCSGSTSTLEHTACVEVQASIDSYSAIRSDTSSADADKLRAKALNELRDALQPAALAASSSSDFQALAATLSESSRVPESDLIQALSAQCASVLSP